MADLPLIVLGFQRHEGKIPAYTPSLSVTFGGLPRLANEVTEGHVLDTLFVAPTAAKSVTSGLQRAVLYRVSVTFRITWSFSYPAKPPTSKNSVPQHIAVTMISDRDLFTLAIFFGVASMLLILAYHFLEADATSNTADARKTKAS
ncbi:hypothetical protein E4U57_000899 [Claviceps arundinis]|uniref:Dolichyl-diphosphooligosaccharide--protein glycosyltransferase subunit 4 n=1 Tax=Claviceps arundinis TaxID=1623583 RepID=A0A9P7MYN9_9HYPO|nr:hypothetical protein E4U57_000899 [Claviceps arundinis]KAG5976271.1 hypothetical protein E4U56_002226 [Claviceps arundinis]